MGSFRQLRRAKHTGAARCKARQLERGRLGHSAKAAGAPPACRAVLSTGHTELKNRYAEGAQLQWTAAAVAPGWQAGGHASVGG